MIQMLELADVDFKATIARKLKGLLKEKKWQNGWVDRETK